MWNERDQKQWKLCLAKSEKKIKNGINKQLVAAIYFALYQPRNQPTTVYPFERTHHFNENHVYSVIYLEIHFCRFLCTTETMKLIVF